MDQLENIEFVFSKNECRVFERYPNRVKWNKVIQNDKILFANIRKKLSYISQRIADEFLLSISFKSETSLYNPNGRSPKEIWTCIYPSSEKNKSYSIQIALIISNRGAEFCFCLGAGLSQLKNPIEKENLQNRFKYIRNQLRTIPANIISSVETDLGDKWFFRNKWLQESNRGDFKSLIEWLNFAGSDVGASASISRYCIGPN